MSGRIHESTSTPITIVSKPSLVPSPSFLALECAGSKKVGPGIHCLRMRYKNLIS